MTLEIRIYKDATGIGNGAFARPFAYSGISAYESIDPGLFSWKNKYNGLSGLPETEKSKKYNWAASVNASLAEFNRSFFTTANLNATDLAAIDSLENAIYSGFSGENPETISRSVAFGKSIADAIFAWGQTDSYIQNNAMPYTVLGGFWSLGSDLAPSRLPVLSGAMTGALLQAAATMTHRVLRFLIPNFPTPIFTNRSMFYTRHPKCLPPIRRIRHSSGEMCRAYLHRVTG